MPCFKRRNATFQNAKGNILTATQLPVGTDVTVAPVGCRFKVVFIIIYVFYQCNKIEAELVIIFFYVRYLLFSKQKGRVIAVFPGVLYEKQRRTYAETVMVVMHIVAYKRRVEHRLKVVVGMLSLNSDGSNTSSTLQGFLVMPLPPVL